MARKNFDEWDIARSGLRSISAPEIKRFWDGYIARRENAPIVHGSLYSRWRRLADDLVMWGDDRRLTLQRLDDAGRVLETRELPTSGYSTTLQIEDIDADGQMDVLVLNSAGKQADVIYGPLWDQATNPKP